MRITITKIEGMKRQSEKIPMVTAYDYTTARLVDEAGIPLILVGDSLGQVMLGYDSTVNVTMDEMIHHVKAVSRGARRAMVVGDMPFMSYRISMEETMRNAARFIQEGGAHAVKLEGGHSVAAAVRRMVECGIPVMGHIGLTPQSMHQLGGYRVQGKTARAAQRLIQDAIALEEAGAFAVVLEMIPAPLAGMITERLHIPTIGIGAGPQCDGQVQVFHDMLGLFRDFMPRHTKIYAPLGDVVSAGLARYAEEVRTQVFPTEEHSHPMDEEVLHELLAAI